MEFNKLTLLVFLISLSVKLNLMCSFFLTSPFIQHCSEFIRFLSVRNGFFHCKMQSVTPTADNSCYGRVMESNDLISSNDLYVFVQRKPLGLIQFFYCKTNQHCIYRRCLTNMERINSAYNREIFYFIFH